MCVKIYQAEVIFVLALQGYYENGRLKLAGEAPERGTVFVIFTENTFTEEMNNADKKLFDKFSGSITRIINEKTELAEGLGEKYAGIN